LLLVSQSYHIVINETAQSVKNRALGPLGCTKGHTC